MTASIKSLANLGLRFVLILFLATLGPMQAQAAELKLELRLIWGTNEPKPSDPKPKPVDPVTAGKLRNVFHWTNYFEINRVTGTVPSRATNSFVMSKKCTIEVTELKGPNVEVTLIGEGKRLNKTSHHLAKGEYFTIGGEDKNGCAWFVLVTELDEK